MHDSMQYDPIQGQSHELMKVGNLVIFYFCTSFCVTWRWSWEKV